jgi:hypothetical protein
VGIDIPSWLTVVIYGIDIPLWLTVVICGIDIPLWLTVVICGIDIPSWLTKSNMNNLLSYHLQPSRNRRPGVVLDEPFSQFIIRKKRKCMPLVWRMLC